MLLGFRCKYLIHQIPLKLYVQCLLYEFSTGPVETTKSPQLRDHPNNIFGIQGSLTDHKILFNKWNALVVIWGVFLNRFIITEKIVRNSSPFPKESLFCMIDLLFKLGLGTGECVLPA
ncbi:hypothetical protein GQ457_05G032390 [Hibiscus cannabinus]